MSPESLRDTKISDLHLTKSAEIVKCLGHPLRLRLLEALERGEMTVSDLQKYAGVSQAAVSQQLGILRGRGVVDFRRDGVYAYYRIVEAKVFKILACIRDCDIAPSPF